MKRIRRISRLLVSGTMVREAVEFAGWATLTYAAYELERVLGLVAAGLVMLLYGRVSIKG